ncbi:hypothetical protein [Cellulosimicrobium cellulans]|uniref:hypothetical protein n=1 Tax=Cellulosimicrobium cellulans TaxID=1710 RepID=UPI0008489D37|nr:hypothetical protein [Cellulosimicrobium cellulans]
MSQDDRRDARDTDETLVLGTSAGTAPTQPLGDAVFGTPAPGAADPAGTGTREGAADRPSTGDPTGSTTGSVPAAADPVAGDEPSTETVRPPRGPRVGTIVWGFVVLAFGAAVLATALGAHVDLGLAAIVVLAVAGVTLVVGSVAVGARRRSRG